MNKGQTRRAFLAAVIQSILYLGCASKLRIKDARFSFGEREIDLMIRPWESFGLKLTEAMKRREVTVIQGVFPDVLFGEWYPNPPRLKWYAWVAAEDGEEFLAQSILSGLSPSGAFITTLVIDGKGPKVDKGKIMQLSTMLDYGYNLAGDEFSLDWKKFVRDTGGYRMKYIRENGTTVSDMRKVKGFFSEVKGWNRYYKRKDPNYVVYSPIEKNKMADLVKIRTGYNFWDMWIGSGSFAVYPMDPVATFIDNAIDVYRVFSGRVPTTGWDYRSELPSRRNMGIIIEYVSKLRQRLIDKLNQQILIERSNAIQRK